MQLPHLVLCYHHMRTSNLTNFLQHTATLYLHPIACVHIPKFHLYILPSQLFLHFLQKSVLYSYGSYSSTESLNKNIFPSITLSQSTTDFPFTSVPQLHLCTPYFAATILLYREPFSRRLIRMFVTLMYIFGQAQSLNSNAANLHCGWNILDFLSDHT